MIKLVPITDVKASEYNPRKNDEKRLALTEMSLRKLGFLLPIYADTSGEILSGHQTPCSDQNGLHKDSCSVCE